MEETTTTMTMTTTTCPKQSGKAQAFACYTGDAEDRTSLAQLVLAQLSHNRQSAHLLRSKQVCLHRKSFWHNNGVLGGFDIRPVIHPANVMPNHLRAGPPFWRSQTLRFPTGPSPSPPRAAASLRLTSWQGKRHRPNRHSNQHIEHVCHPYPRLVRPVRTTIQALGCQAWRSCAAEASSPRRRSWQAVTLFDADFGKSGIHTHSELG